MSNIIEKIQEMADAMKKMSETFDAQADVEDPELPAQESTAGPVWIKNLEEEDEAEKWRKRADVQMDTIARFFRSIAIVAVLGLFWIVLMTIDLGYPGTSMSFTEILVNILWIVVVAAALAVYVRHKIESSQSRVDDDSKDAKKRQQDDNKSRVLALFLFFSALLMSLMMIWYSMSSEGTPFEVEEDYFIARTSLVPDVVTQHEAIGRPFAIPRIKQGRTKPY